MGIARLSRLLLLAAVASVIPGDGLDEHSFFYYQFAGSSYCTNASLAAWNCTPCTLSNTTLLSLQVFENDRSDARAVLAAVKPPGSDTPMIALSWRGTETLENWIENLEVLRTDRNMSCAGCTVHSGFYKVWSSLAGRILYELGRLQQRYPGAPLTIVGHSLGGAVATVMAYVLVFDLQVNVSSVYTYGSPRVGNDAFAAAFSKGMRSVRVTHNRDIVPHLPPDHLFGFHHVARELFFENSSRIGQRCDGTGEDPSCSRRYAIALSVHDHLNYYGQTIGENGCGDSRLLRNTSAADAAAKAAPPGDPWLGERRAAVRRATSA